MLSNTLSLDEEEAVQAELQKLQDEEAVSIVSASLYGMYLMTCIGDEGAYYQVTTCSGRRAIRKGARGERSS